MSGSASDGTPPVPAPGAAAEASEFAVPEGAQGVSPQCKGGGPAFPAAPARTAVPTALHTGTADPSGTGTGVPTGTGVLSGSPAVPAPGSPLVPGSSLAPTSPGSSPDSPAALGLPQPRRMEGRKRRLLPGVALPARCPRSGAGTPGAPGPVSSAPPPGVRRVAASRLPLREPEILRFRSGRGPRCCRALGRGGGVPRAAGRGTGTP